MTETRIPTAVLGAAGYIGQHFLRLLADHPYFAPPIAVGSSRTEGAAIDDRWLLTEEMPASVRGTRLTRLGPAQLAARGVRVVFGALPSGEAGPIETECRRRGLHVFTNSADHRSTAGVPLLVPEVNAEHLRSLPVGRRPLLVANPNCSATGLVLGLAPVWGLLRPRSVEVATYQALSGAGYPGVSSLSITDNVVPYIAREEEKIEEESRRLFGTARGGRIRPSAAEFRAQCARVPVRDGHLEAVTLLADRRPSGRELLSAWRRFDPLHGLELPTAPHPPIVLRPEADRPQPLRDRWAGSPARARGMAVSIGRVRWQPPHLRFFLLSHNAVRGGAGGSLLNAELAYAEGRLNGPTRPFP